jgi:hypothetical protein
MNGPRTKTKGLLLIALAFGLSVCLYLFLNIETSIQQGINGKVSAIKMPLYAKLMDFCTRSNHYKLLTESIIKGRDSTDKEKLIALFDWTAAHIRHVPNGFPIVDDHVDNIIIRGYGTDDQSADVFTTLATYAGFKGGIYLTKIYPEKRVHAMSIVAHGHRKLLFDTYAGYYFLNEKKEIASIDDIAKNIDLVKSIVKDVKIFEGLDYYRFFENVKSVDNISWTKADMQMPSKRLIHGIGRLFNITQPSQVFFGESYSLLFPALRDYSLLRFC